MFREGNLVVSCDEVGKEKYLRSKRMEESEYIYYTNLAGVTHTNDDGSDRQKIVKTCRVGKTVNLIRDHENPHDKNAIKVCRESGEQLGWINKDVAENFAVAIDIKKYNIWVKIKELFKFRDESGKKIRGCSINIMFSVIPIQIPEPEPVCPHCSFRLEKMPAQKKKCPSCGKYFYVKTDPKTEQKVLVDEKQADELKHKLSLFNIKR